MKCRNLQSAKKVCMIYRAIGLMSGSSLDGLDICFAEFDENGGRWSYSIKAAECLPYSEEWADKLANATQLPALDYLRLHTAYGKYIGEQVNHFIDENNLHHQVALVASHGHTVFHEPHNLMTAQLGDGAAIAAATNLNVVSDLRSMDIALGGQGAPIVPIGEKLLFNNFKLLLNLGGIANISLNETANTGQSPIAFDICPANRVLNLLANETGLSYDENGRLAATGIVEESLLQQLNVLDYYRQPAPKSLANDFGTHTIFPLLMQSGFSIPNLLRTYVEHIVTQITAAISNFSKAINPLAQTEMLVTGGGAFNSFLIETLQQKLFPLGVEITIPDRKVIEFKEALIMALIGILRWREEENVLASVTGASRSSVGGALWLGQL
jgi:anhydro-N-acetylmuramic acid kinase